MPVETTPLDSAHGAMIAAPDDASARLGFYDTLAQSELFLLLEAEPDGDQVTPQVFDVAEGRYVLVFDREERLSAFAGGVAPYAALSGRTVAQMLADQGIGLGLNLEVAPSAILLPAEALGWLAATVGQVPDQVVATLHGFSAPIGLPETLIAALDRKLAMAAGLARVAYLTGTTDAAGGKGHLLAIVGAPEAAQPALTQAVSEALIFSGIEAGALDVGFLGADDPVVSRLASVALCFELPEPLTPEPLSAPGSDPSRPPILR